MNWQEKIFENLRFRNYLYMSTQCLSVFKIMCPSCWLIYLSGEALFFPIIANIKLLWPLFNLRQSLCIDVIFMNLKSVVH